MAPDDDRTRAFITAGSKAPRPLRQGVISGLTLRATDLAQKAALYSHRAFIAGGTASPYLVERMSPHAALRSACHAYQRVPAYRAFADRSGWQDNDHLSVPERISRLPEMDKANYIKVFSTAERCLDGHIPMVGTEVDESSGSSGTPFNWVRSRCELEELHRAMGQY